MVGIKSIGEECKLHWTKVGTNFGLLNSLQMQFVFHTCNSCNGRQGYNCRSKVTLRKKERKRVDISKYFWTSPPMSPTTLRTARDDSEIIIIEEYEFSNANLEAKCSIIGVRSPNPSPGCGARAPAFRPATNHRAPPLYSFIHQNKRGVCILSASVYLQMSGFNLKEWPNSSPVSKTWWRMLRLESRCVIGFLLHQNQRFIDHDKVAWTMLC